MDDLIEFLIDKGARLKNESLSKERDNLVIHPSTIGSCKRRILYDLKGIKGATPDARALRIFQNGHKTHERLSEYLKMAGALVHEELPLSSNEFKIPIKCSVDAVINVNGEQVILDFKTISDAGFRRLLSDANEVKKDYLWQLNLYMHLTGILKAYLVYENKNDQQILVQEVKYDTQIIELIRKKINSLHWHLKRNKLPPKESGWFCTYCPHKEWCKA